VDDDVFFQTSCVKGPQPVVADRVLVEALYNPSMPFKWNASKVQVLNLNQQQQQQHQQQHHQHQPRNQRQGSAPLGPRDSGYNAVPPPGFSGPAPAAPAPERRPYRDARRRSRSPRRDSRRERSKERISKERDSKRKRSRSRSRSPARRRTRPRYNVQVPKIQLQISEANTGDIKKRYSSLYIPSDVFMTRPLWSDTFPAHRPFQPPRPVPFHVMSKEVAPLSPNPAVYDPPDVCHDFSAKVMLLSAPPLEEIYRRSGALSEDEAAAATEAFVHPTRLLSFCVGLKGKAETMAIGGAWSPKEDGADPAGDKTVLIRTAIRTCRALTGIDLSGCTTWYRFAEIYYGRSDGVKAKQPAGSPTAAVRVETTVVFIPDVWNISPTKLEWDELQLSYKRALDRELALLHGEVAEPEAADCAELDGDQDDQEFPKRADPTPWAQLDIKNMKVVELRTELDARLLNSKGLRSQLAARLTKALKGEQEKEEAAAAAEEAARAEAALAGRLLPEDERRREEERKRREEEEARREEEAKRKALEKAAAELEARHTLPPQPSLLVHPSSTAKGGRFDAATMSLSVLLDYTKEDNKEHSFEMSLFAEMFNEMLMRDFAFRIYRALEDAPPREDEKKKESGDKEKKKDEADDKKEVIEVEPEPKRKRRDKFKTEVELEEDAILDLDFEVEEEDFFKDESKSEPKTADKDSAKSVVKSSEAAKSSSTSSSSSSQTKKRHRSGSPRKKMVTVDPWLLLAFVYFDTTRTGYILDRDLEDIIGLLGMNLSRAQMKKLTSKVVSRDALHYRRLTDAPAEDAPAPAPAPAPPTLLEALARGNRAHLPVFGGAPAVKVEAAAEAAALQYQGSLLSAHQLLAKLTRSEAALKETEEKLDATQRSLKTAEAEAASKAAEAKRLAAELATSTQLAAKGEEELTLAHEDSERSMAALRSIRDVLRPLVGGLDGDDDMDIVKPNGV